jgi:hypothetical protein
MRRRPRYLSALGMVVVETTGMEFLLGELLGAVMRTDPEVGVALYHAPKSNTARLDILASAIEAVLIDKSEAKKRLEKLVKRARSCITRRNEYVHGLWGLSRNRREVLVRMPPADAKQVKLDDLKYLARDLRDVATEAELHKNAMYRQIERSASRRRLTGRHPRTPILGSDRRS